MSTVNAKEPPRFPDPSYYKEKPIPKKQFLLIIAAILTPFFSLLLLIK